MPVLTSGDKFRRDSTRCRKCLAGRVWLVVRHLIRFAVALIDLANSLLRRVGGQLAEIATLVG